MFYFVPAIVLVSVLVYVICHKQRHRMSQYRSSYTETYHRLLRQKAAKYYISVNITY